MRYKVKLTEGTEFRITFDFEKAAAMEVDMVLPSWNMLVVDDDELLCRTAMNALKSIGIKAECTLSGERAIESGNPTPHAREHDYQTIQQDCLITRLSCMWCWITRFDGSFSAERPFSFYSDGFQRIHRCSAQ